MIVLGIDPGYALMGWGVVEAQGARMRLLGYGCVETQAGVPMQHRLRALQLGVRDLVTDQLPTASGLGRPLPLPDIDVLPDRDRARRVPRGRLRALCPGVDPDVTQVVADGGFQITSQSRRQPHVVARGLTANAFVGGAGTCTACRAARAYRAGFLRLALGGRHRQRLAQEPVNASVAASRVARGVDSGRRRVSPSRRRGRRGRSALCSAVLVVSPFPVHACPRRAVGRDLGHPSVRLRGSAR